MRVRSLDDVRARVLQALASTKSLDGKCTANAARYLKYANRLAR